MPRPTVHRNTTPPKPEKVEAEKPKRGKKKKDDE